MDNALMARGVTKTIQGHCILDNIHLTVQAGEICGIIGRNASGKSMLFKAITGLITTDGGKISIFGRPMGHTWYAPGTIGALIEYPGFLPQFSGRENLRILASICRTTDDEAIDMWMRKLDLDPSDKRPFKKYSLGMRQKLGLAAALMETPRLLILDEPTNNLDEESIALLYDVLREVHQIYGTTMLLSSHRREDIETLCSTVYQMEKGRLTVCAAQ